MMTQSKRTRLRASVSALFGLTLAFTTASAAITIPLNQEPYVDTYCTGSGTPQNCPFGTQYEYPSCGNISIEQRPYGYCCQKWVARCIGSSTGWTVGSASPYFGYTCGADGRCTSSATGPVEPPNPGTPTAE